MTARYPLQALLDATGLAEHAFGQHVGLSGSSIKKARELGLVETAADKYACRAGLTPWLVWPDWLEGAEVRCPECDCGFVPSRRSHVYCTRACYQRRFKRDRSRERYATDPVFRAAQVEKSRRYREGNGRASAVKKAAYYQANKARILAQKRARYRQSVAA